MGRDPCTRRRGASRRRAQTFHFFTPVAFARSSVAGETEEEDEGTARAIARRIAHEGDRAAVASKLTAALGKLAEPAGPATTATRTCGERQGNSSNRAIHQTHHTALRPRNFPP